MRQYSTAHYSREDRHIGDHANDEIYKEIHGYYPWEDMARAHPPRSVYNGDGSVRKSKGKGFRNYRGLRLFMGSDKKIPKTIKRLLIQQYAHAKCGYSVHEAATSSNEKIATEIQKNFAAFGKWFKELNGNYEF